MTDNYPPGAADRSDAPYNYDPKTEVECTNCLLFITIEDSKVWNDDYFCDNDTCLQMYLNE